MQVRSGLLGFALALTLGNARAADGMADPVHVRLKPFATVSTRRYTLGDIAELQGGRPGAATELAAMPVGLVPRAGNTDRVSKEELRRLARERLPWAYSGIAWEGADVTRVETAFRPFDTGRVVETAAAYLVRALAMDDARISVRAADDLPELRLPEGLVTLRARPQPRAVLLQKRVSVLVDVSLDGVFYRSISVPLVVEAYRPVQVSRAELPMGQVLRCEDFESRTEDIAGLGGEPASVPCGATPARLKRGLGAGAVLTQALLEPLPAVAKGETVSLDVVSGAIRIQSRALALADGWLGQRIRVQPTTAQEAIAANVVAPGMVAVLEN